LETAQLAATTPKVTSRRSRRISKFQLFNTRPFLNLDFDAENGDGKNSYDGDQNSLRAMIFGDGNNDHIGPKNDEDILSSMSDVFLNTHRFFWAIAGYGKILFSIERFFFAQFMY